MIGFGEEPISDRKHDNEPLETKKLGKKEFYDMVALKYYIPPYKSRGICRGYLLKVFKNEVYRVGNMELKSFEVHLEPAMNKRIGLQNNCFLVKKINQLLKSRNQNVLGFNEYDPPEVVHSSH